MKERPIRVMVDLTEVRPGGETGGAKYFVFEFLQMLANRPGWGFEFAYLTNTATHDEVLHELARPCDRLVCIRELGGAAPPVPSPFGGQEEVLMPPPADLAIRLGADVAYCPFGSVSNVSPGVPIVAFVADLLHRDYPLTLPPEGVRFRESQFVEMVARTAYFQCNSLHVAGRLHEHYGVAADRMFHTYNVIHDRLDPDASFAPPAACPPGPFFFYPANAWPHKNHEGLIVAYRAYRAEHGADAWPLVLTGHVDDRKRELAQWAEALGLGDSVTFLGHIPEDQLAAVWRQAGALVFPSLHEGFGIPLLEAMHFSVPIACSDLCSLPEIAGDAALLFYPRKPAEIARALGRLATDETLRSELAAAGRVRLTAMSADAEAAKLAQHLHMAVHAWPLPACAGQHVDGWVSDCVVVGLPKHEAGGSLAVRFHDHSPRARFVVSAGLRPLGTFAPLDHPDREFVVEVLSGTRTVVIDVVGGENLNPADPRIHGARLTRVTFRDRCGAPTAVMLAHET
jgi:glycosyltransferase involved in cell wall biosynthesis